VPASVPSRQYPNQLFAAYHFTNKKVWLADNAESFQRSVHKYIAVVCAKIARNPNLAPGTEGSVLIESADGRQIATANLLIAL